MKSVKLKKSKFLSTEFMALYFVVFMGAYLRLQSLFFSTFAFTYDVGRDLLAVADIVNKHNIPFIGPTTGIPGVFYGPWWYYILTPFFFIFNGDPRGIDFMMVFFGTITIILGYVLGKKIRDGVLGLILAAIIAVSQILIAFSSQIWNPNIAPFFTILILICLYEIFSKKEKVSKYYFLIGLLLALCTDIEIFFGVILLIGTMISLVSLNLKKIKLINILFLIMGGVLVLLPRIAFEVKNNFLITQAFFKFITVKDPLQQSLKFMKIVEARINVFFDLFNFTIANSNQVIGVVFLIFMFVSLVLFKNKLNSLEKKFIAVCVITISVFFLTTIFFKHEIYPHYLAGLPIYFLLIFSISIASLRNINKGILVPASFIFLIFIINVDISRNIETIQGKNIWGADIATYKNQQEIIDFVYNEANGKNFKHVVYTPPVNDYTYRYLFSWYGKSKYGYVPSDKARLAFFIIEPDPKFPQRIKDWLEARKNDGKIIKISKLKNGVIVQTRVTK